MQFTENIQRSQVQTEKPMRGTLYATMEAKTGGPLTFDEIKWMAATPEATAKLETALITPTDAPGKTKDAVMEHNRMTFCWADIDSGDRNLSEVVNRCKEFGIGEVIIYSSASAKRLKNGVMQGHRWRILFNLASALMCERWEILQQALGVIFEGGAEAVRIQQGMFAPTNPDNGYYEYQIIDGKPLDPLNLPANVAKLVREIIKQEESLQEMAASAPIQPRNPSDCSDIIGKVNEANKMEDVLKSLKYVKKSQNKWLHPKSTSGAAGVVLLNGRYYSHHETDPLHDGHTHDVFDVLKCGKFEGDEKAAVAHYAEELDPEGQRQRQREYMGAQDNGNQDRSAKEEVWALAQELFPRTPFPWRVFPAVISASFQQLARSCASSSDHLPGTALAILASVLGRSLSISPKHGWSEPLIPWLADLRPSGEGKTPTARMLMKIVQDTQKAEHLRYKTELAAYEKDMAAFKSLSKKQQASKMVPQQPKKPRGFFVTDLTLEGLRTELEDHPTGGLAVCVDELSSFVSGQNQYKSKGNDRESWLCLHDGKPARIVRASKTIYLQGARVSLFGGIQPEVFRKAFCSDDGVYLTDGTLYRFLFTYERATHHKLTGESWSDGNRAAWETILQRALTWANGQIDATTGSIGEPVGMNLDSEAQARFFEWRNSLDLQKSKVHSLLRGFIPKASGYALRLGALITALWCFYEGRSPKPILTLEDIDRGIDSVEFYLGQTVDAMKLIEDPGHCPADTSERIKHLAETLDSLRGEVDSGRLAVGFIQARFNQGLSKEKQMETAKAMGALLRSIPLTKSAGRHDANGRKGAYCLEWDSKTELFIQQSSGSSGSSETKSQQSFASLNIEQAKFGKFRSGEPGNLKLDTSRTLEKRSSGLGYGVSESAANFPNVLNVVPAGEFEIDWPKVERGAEKLRERTTYPDMKD